MEVTGSIRINELPPFLGDSAGTWLIVNNSSGTVTSKITREALLIGWGGGTSGTSGINGSSGSNGTNGTSGTNGSSGSSGSNGTNGSSGSSGSNGTDGSSGSSGSNGTNGSSGSSGSNGTDGSSGSSGSNGTNGSSGSNGTDGSSGSSGSNGTNGSSGSNGTNGSSGTSGDSLFAQTGSYWATTNNLQITGSVKIKGTITAEEYYVTLISSSVMFVSGSNNFGNTLDDNHNFTGSVNISGSLTINGTSYTAATSGTSGSNGTDGSSGSNGTNGSSGSSGSNGTDGSSGSNGTNGSSGSSGSNGTDGSSGSNGTNGSSGSSGSNGTNGSSGSSGSNGTDGSSGSNGSSGSSGSNGTGGSSGTSFIWKGDWVSATVYVKNDTVSYTGSSYTCITGHTSTTGITPTNILYWNLMAQAGTSGSSGSSGSNGTNGTSGDSIFAQTGSFWNATKDIQITGSLHVIGNLTAQQYIVSSSVYYVTESTSSGSNAFGNTLDDYHKFTGSVYVSGSSHVITGSLTVSGSVSATAFFELSDIRYKDIISVNPNVDLSTLDVIQFTLKGDNQVRYGYSAQSVKEACSDLVVGDLPMSVNYNDVHTLKIHQLENKIKQLENKIESLYVIIMDRDNRK